MENFLKMDAELAAIEEDLKGMAPAMLSEGLVHRLAGAMDEAAAEGAKVVSAGLQGDLADLEASLRSFVPRGMPENMISRLDEAMSRWHEKVPLEEKVVPLISSTGEERRFYRPGFPAVAAVALMGVGAALLMPGDLDEAPMVSRRIPVINPANPAPVVFTPGDARSSVVSSNDRGVIWTEGGIPVRCFELEVNNEVFFTNERGEQLIIVQPKREVMFTPIKLD